MRFRLWHLHVLNNDKHVLDCFTCFYSEKNIFKIYNYLCLSVIYVCFIRFSSLNSLLDFENEWKPNLIHNNWYLFKVKAILQLIIDSMDVKTEYYYFEHNFLGTNLFLNISKNKCKKTRFKPEYNPILT